MMKNVSWQNICNDVKAVPLFVVAVSLFFSTSAISATWKIYYPKPEDELDIRTTYPLSVLTLALNHTGVRYHLIPSQRPLPQGKSIKQLKANREVSLVWSMTDKVREQELLPIRIPIYKGLIGWRLFLVKPQHKDAFKQFTTLAELRQFLPVQGHDWPDTKILRANGFEVVTDTEFDKLFQLIDNERANFFPRSIVEIWDELDINENNLVVEPHMAIRYPTATYFFFNRKNQVLANLIETGFRRAIASGEFDKLFLKVHQQFLSQANLSDRIIFELKNPILPEQTPKGEAALWYNGELN
ncbi:MAG: amino acid ABC transporter substrate-binding protein [Aestuariibacter sp.]